MDNDENRSLKETFEAVREQQVELETLDTRGAQFKHTLESIIHDLEQCRKLVNNLSVFSPNEELDDISTPSIQYLTIDYLLADLLLKTYDSNRLAALRRASRLLDSFLGRLDQYGLLSKTDRELYEKFKDNRSAFSLLSASNFEDRRKLKIARFQEEKSLKQKLEVGLPIGHAVHQLIFSHSIYEHNPDHRMSTKKLYATWASLKSHLTCINHFNHST